jgi:tetratricopeptide (TPR) repeat protein
MGGRLKNWLDDGTELDTHLGVNLVDWESGDSGPDTPADGVSRGVIQGTELPPPIVPAVLPAPTADLGRFVLLKKLGQGGMGVVYAAFDPQLNRRVAIKLLKGRAGAAAGTDTARLMREGQAMARLSHPNVVSIYDVGWCDGNLFVAMELVEGNTLRQWLKGSSRSWREILDAHVQAGRGLAAAHGAGLVHRDFKPENVLMGTDGRVCVTDFGLARRAGEEDPGSTAESPSDEGLLASRITRIGAVMGTARYMAPEQFGTGLTDGRTDQFAFCVALYEALYDQLPFVGKTVPARMLEASRGRVEPPPESTPVPRRLHRILSRGLAANPEERYPSMDALLKELAGVPMVIRRRWMTLGATAAAALVAGVTIHQIRSARAQMCRGADARLTGVWDGARRQAAAAAFGDSGVPEAGEIWSAVRQALDGYAAGWVAMHTEACEAAWVEKRQTPVEHSRRMVCLERRRDGLRAVAGLFEKADAEVVGNATKAVAGLSPLSDCADLKTLARQPVPEGISDPKLDEVRIALAQSKALRDAGKFVPAIETAERAAGEARRLGNSAMEAEALLQWGELLESHGSHDEAEETLLAAEVAAEIGGHDLARAKIALELAMVLGDSKSRLEEGFRWLRSARAVMQRIGGGDALEATAERVHGLLLWQNNQSQDAIPHLQRSLEIRERVFGPDSLEAGAAALNLGVALEDLGQFEQALAHYLRDYAISARVAGKRHPDTGISAHNLGSIYIQLERYDEAMAHLREEIVINTEAHGADHPAVGDAHQGIGEVMIRLRRWEEARAHHQRALHLLTRWYGPKYDGLAGPLSGLAEVALRTGNAPEAARLSRRALALAPKVDLDTRGEALFTMARAQWEMGEFAEGLGHAREALKLLSVQKGTAPKKAKVAAWLLQPGRKD